MDVCTHTKMNLDNQTLLQDKVITGIFEYSDDYGRISKYEAPKI